MLSRLKRSDADGKAVSDAVEEAVETAVKSSLERIQEWAAKRGYTAYEREDGVIVLECDTAC